MGFSDWIKRKLEKGREKYKLSLINAANYHEKWSFKVSILNLYSLLALYTITIIVVLFFLIRYTVLSNLFLDIPPKSSVEQIYENSQMIDSLNNQIRSRQKYIDDLQKILLGEPFDDSLYNSSSSDSLYVNYDADFSKSEQDSILRSIVENEDIPQTEQAYAFFSAPVTGTVSRSFNPDKKHLGVDVVTEPDTPIKSCLEGVVIFTGSTTNEGNVVMVQHSNDYISVYKHCSSILKKVGDKVQTADPLGLVGTSGKHTTGPHLHFEIWKKGIPLNPQEFINFQK
ncbi:MAG: M23 family metallopeptidase [Crocinitomicaceae bacterium]|nr:M23 family metallopeptidase [Crocinitomicaceae bacterium]